MTREQMIQALEARARELGWEDITIDDDGAQLQILVGAQGACEQVVTGNLAGCRKELGVLGGPLEYPAVEEYELEQADLTMQLAQEEAADKAAGPEMAPEPTGGAEVGIGKVLKSIFLGPDIGPSEDISNAGKTVAVQLAEAVVVNPPLSPKEIWQAKQSGDTGPDGVPHPEQLAEALVKSKVVVIVKGQRFMAPEGYCIKERRPDGKVVLYASLLKGRKLNYQARGSSFTLCPL